MSSFYCAWAGWPWQIISLFRSSVFSSGDWGPLPVLPTAFARLPRESTRSDVENPMQPACVKIKGTGSQSDRPWFKSWSCCLPAIWPSISCLSAVYLRFLIRERRQLIVFSPWGCFENVEPKAWPTVKAQSVLDLLQSCRPPRAQGLLLFSLVPLSLTTDLEITMHLLSLNRLGAPTQAKEKRKYTVAQNGAPEKSKMSCGLKATSLQAYF